MYGYNKIRDKITYRDYTTNIQLEKSTILVSNIGENVLLSRTMSINLVRKILQLTRFVGAVLNVII